MKLRARFKMTVAQPFRAAGAAVGRPEGVRYGGPHARRSDRRELRRAPSSSNNATGQIGVENEAVTRVSVRNIWLKKLN